MASLSHRLHVHLTAIYSMAEFGHFSPSYWLFLKQYHSLIGGCTLFHLYFFFFFSHNKAYHTPGKITFLQHWVPTPSVDIYSI